MNNDETAKTLQDLTGLLNAMNDELCLLRERLTCTNALTTFERRLFNDAEARTKAAATKTNDTLRKIGFK